MPAPPLLTTALALLPFSSFLLPFSHFRSKFRAELPVTRVAVVVLEAGDHLGGRVSQVR